ncbi:hypothetical protein [Agrobacterium pusense]|uniref:hypothetical protein n=1 Tax=Agrobacterium pusense TaxID=648995 RepID=UPI0005148B31|nr:hypothetical protein [Agrobacterium pusense]ANV26850.1 hypothetical protein BA939_23525 [Rhizobium sp. S41]KGE80424.1 hypothetical protein LW14_23420 [Rhizobium sp. H41]QWW75883.1 hypothetical protein KP800_21840 [Agrobacterium pusense]
MEQITREALEASIRHWQEITEVTAYNQVNIGPDDCALCQLFNIHDEDNEDQNCIGCPVRDATGKRYCKDSPYLRVNNIKISWWEGKSKLEDFIAAAKDELDFLISLRSTDSSLPSPTK